jgi:hypothetical protein
LLVPESWSPPGAEVFAYRAVQLIENEAADFKGTSNARRFTLAQDRIAGALAAPTVLAGKIHDAAHAARGSFSRINRRTTSDSEQYCSEALARTRFFMSSLNRTTTTGVFFSLDISISFIHGLFKRLHKWLPHPPAFRAVAIIGLNYH